MIRKSLWLVWLFLVSAPVWCSAQPFVDGNGDLLAGFRKTGTHQANYELVVNLGNITNFEALAPGATLTMTHFSPGQLSDAVSSFSFLQWSVSAAFPGTTRWAGFPSASLWYTRPRTDLNTQTPLPPRLSLSAQQNTRQRILGISAGAASISASLGTSNLDNNIYLVREPINSGAGLTAYIRDQFDPSIGNFFGTLSFDVENVTPSVFSSAVRSDLYQVCPVGVPDPVSGSTSNAYFVGFFELSPDGTMTFTRASTNSVTQLPPPPVLSLSFSNASRTISFVTTNGATYTLYYTNAGGLNSPVSTWATGPGTVTGDGSTKSFNDTSTDPNRLYRVRAN